MKISNITIKNYKTFDENGVTFSLESLTALIGENSVGKSNVLEALDLFFNFSKTKISTKSFHHNNYIIPIIIECKFVGLLANELDVFKSHLDDNNELIITQKIQAISKNENEELTFETQPDDIDFVESKHGTLIKPTEEYEWITLTEKVPNKTNLKKWWKQELIIDHFDFKSYFTSSDLPTQEEFYSNLKRLWAEHSDIIPKEKITGDEKVLGWKSKLKSNLPKFFYIPAIKKLEDDLKVTGSSPLGEMIKWLSNSVSKDIKEEFQKKSSELVESLFEKIDKDEEGKSKIESLNTALNENIGIDLGCELNIKFGIPEIKDVIFPEPKIFANDGYDSELTQKGHGLQRLAIFSLLRTYNTFAFDKTKRERNIIIGIEEPEIYLHPPIKRATYKLLRKISESNDQVIYTTHDSFFISVETFDEIKLFRKIQERTLITKVFEFNYEQLQFFYKKEYGIDTDIKSLKHRFYHLIDESKNEGFFAKKIVLIEGETEKYSLPIYFSHKGFDLDQNRISLISAGSVDNISFLLMIFNEFRIPCYIIFDGDKPKGISLDDLTGEKKNDAKNKSRRNKELYKFINENYNDDLFFFPETTISDKHSVWKYDFESEFHETLDNYDKLKSDAKKLYGTDSKPLTARFIAERIVNEFPDKIDDKIEILINKIKKIKWTNSILD